MKLLLALFSKFAYWFLNLFALLILNLARPVGVAYAKLWGFFGITWFDHRFDWLLGPEGWAWNERGIYGAKLILSGDKVLDLCCGDGIYAGLFYSKFAGLVHAIDRDEKAISLARRRYSRENVKFFRIDITKEDFPSDHYDLVFMFQAIEHLSSEQGTLILQRIAKSLSVSTNGSFFGSTPIFDHVTGHGNLEHKNEFTSLQQLQDFLSPHFAEIELWGSKWGLGGERRDTYFLCRKPIVSSEKL